MTRDESRTLAITAGVLFLAGAVRAGLEAVRPPLTVHADTVSARALAADSREMLDEEERRSAPLAPGERIDPNTATEEDLDRLPGIGPAAARAIVESRAAEGPFADAGALTRVRGIGPATVERLAQHLALAASGGGRRARRPSGPTTTTAARRTTSPANPPDESPIDLNRATAEELEGVRGIGPALAARIIARRTEVGGFSRVEDLLEVRGIGPAMLETARRRFFVRR